MSLPLSSCLISKAVLGLGLGLLLRLDPLLAPLGLGFETNAPLLATSIPFNGGTGFFVSADGAFIAPYHVIGDCPRPALQTPAGLVVGEPIAASAGLDIAVAHSNTRPEHFAAFAQNTRLAFGQPLTVVRYRGCGGPPSRDILEASAQPLSPRITDLLALDAVAPIEGGNSGSPVVDAAGAVVGMIVARASAEARTGIAVDGTTLKGFLLGAGIDIEIVPDLLPLAPGLAGALAVQYTFPIVCLY